MPAEEGKASIPALHFHPRPITNNSLFGNRFSCVISGKAGCCFRGTGAVSPRGGGSPQGAGRTRARPPARAPRASPSPVETSIQLSCVAVLTPKQRSNRKHAARFYLWRNTATTLYKNISKSCAARARPFRKVHFAPVLGWQRKEGGSPPDCVLISWDTTEKE